MVTNLNQFNCQFCSSNEDLLPDDESHLHVTQKGVTGVFTNMCDNVYSPGAVRSMRNVNKYCVIKSDESILSTSLHENEIYQSHVGKDVRVHMMTCKTKTNPQKISIKAVNEPVKQSNKITGDKVIRNYGSRIIKITLTPAKTRSTLGASNSHCDDTSSFKVEIRPVMSHSVGTTNETRVKKLYSCKKSYSDIVKGDSNTKPALNIVINVRTNDRPKTPKGRYHNPEINIKPVINNLRKNEWQKSKKQINLSRTMNQYDMEYHIQTANRFQLLESDCDLEDDLNSNDEDVGRIRIRNVSHKPVSKSRVNQKKKKNGNKRSNERKQMLIGFANTRSVRKKAEVLNDYVHEKSLDIFFTTESWLYDDNKHDQKIIGDLKEGGYSFKSENRNLRQGGSIGVLHKNEIAVKKIKPPMINLNKEQPTPIKTMELLECTLTTKFKKVRLICIYRPDPSPVNKYTLSEFFEEFSELLAHYNLYKEEIILIGDYNFHVNHPDKHDPKIFLELLELHNMKQLVTEPTHILIPRKSLKHRMLRMKKKRYVNST